MPKICGDVKVLENPRGGGWVVNETEYTDGTIKRTSFKNRMVFPTIQIGTTTLKKSFVANDSLGHEIANNINVGDRVCMFTYGHLLRKQVIIGVKSDKGPVFKMPRKGFYAGLFWYVVIQPIIVAIPAIIVGMFVGMVGGKQGTAFGLLMGLLYAVGISWYSAFRFYNACQEMQSAGL